MPSRRAEPFALALIVALIFTAPVRACDFPVPPLAQRLREPAVIAEGRVEALEPTRAALVKIARIRILRASKGARPGARLRVRYSEEGDCSDRIPAVGSVHWLVLAGQRGKVHEPVICCGPVPGQIGADRLLADYHGTWMRLADDAERRPDSLDAQRALAGHLGFWGDDAGALPAYERALRLAPRDPALLTGRGLSLMRLGRVREADRAFARALTIDPAYARARLLRIRAAIGHRRWTPAFTNLAKFGQYTPDRPGVDLAYRDLSGADLRGLDFTDIDFTGVKAPGSDWTQIRLTYVGLDGAVLVRADLTQAVMTRTRLVGADLSEARAPEAWFRVADLAGARARGLDAPRSVFQSASMPGADFTGANLAEANFSRTRASRASFEDANLVEARLDEADLSRATFGTARLDRARLDKADLRGADLSRASLDGATLASAKVDCATRLPAGFDAARAKLVLTQACPTASQASP